MTAFAKRALGCLGVPRLPSLPVTFGGFVEAILSVRTIKHGGRYNKAPIMQSFDGIRQPSGGRLAHSPSRRSPRPSHQQNLDGASTTSVKAGHGLTSVNVRLKRINCDQGPSLSTGGGASPSSAGCWQPISFRCCYLRFFGFTADLLGAIGGDGKPGVAAR